MTPIAKIAAIAAAGGLGALARHALAGLVTLEKVRVIACRRKKK